MKKSYFGSTIPSTAVTIVCALLLSGCSSETQPTPHDNGVEIEASAEEIHAASLVLDGHADIVIARATGQYLGADGRSKVAVGKLKAGGVDAVIMSIAVPPGATRSATDDAAGRALADQKFSALNALINDHPDTLVLATSAQQIAAAQSNGKIAIIVGFQNARALESNVDALDAFYAKGVRVFGLNHIGHNGFSDSSRPLYDGASGVYEAAEEHGGLSDLGRQAIGRINQLGGIIDVSQSSKVATLEIAALSNAPIIASHSNVRALSNVTRNLSDAEIDAIAAKEGVVHLVPFGAYLVDLSDPTLREAIKAVRLKAGLPGEGYAYPYELYWEIDDPAEKMKFLLAMRDVIGPGNVERLVDHIDYVVERVGIDHVGIGSDFNHGGGVEGYSEADEALNVTKALVERGYSQGDVKKIWGGNFLRVLRAVETAASPKDE